MTLLNNGNILRDEEGNEFIEGKLPRGRKGSKAIRGTRKQNSIFWNNGMRWERVQEQNNFPIYPVLGEDILNDVMSQPIHASPLPWPPPLSREFGSINTTTPSDRIFSLNNSFSKWKGLLFSVNGQLDEPTGRALRLFLRSNGFHASEFHPLLSHGGNGIVLALQQFLQTNGMGVPSDGSLGLETVEELQVFLNNNTVPGIQKLPVSGSLDEDTVIRLQSFLLKYREPSTNGKQESSSSADDLLQQGTQTKENSDETRFLQSLVDSRRMSTKEKQAMKSWLSYLRKEVLRDIGGDPTTDPRKMDRFNEVLRIGFTGFKEQMLRDERTDEIIERPLRIHEKSLGIVQESPEFSTFSKGINGSNEYELIPLRILKSTHQRIRIVCRDNLTSHHVVANVFVGGKLAGSEDDLSLPAFEFLRDQDRDKVQRFQELFNDTKDEYFRIPRISPRYSQITTFAGWPAWIQDYNFGHTVGDFQLMFLEIAAKIMDYRDAKGLNSNETSSQNSSRMTLSALSRHIILTVMQIVEMLLRVAHTLLLLQRRSDETQKTRFIVSSTNQLCLDNVIMPGAISTTEFLDMVELSAGIEEDNKGYHSSELLRRDRKIRNKNLESKRYPIGFPPSLVRFGRIMFEELLQLRKKFKLDDVNIIFALEPLVSLHGSFRIQASWILDIFQEFDKERWSVRFPVLSLVKLNYPISHGNITVEEGSICQVCDIDTNGIWIDPNFSESSSSSASLAAKRVSVLPNQIHRL
eukprot:CAMPEP_0167766042 /NCGR_PEP_ID=MMETSP0110_2-20121227/15089_1 /TAXON_ID=629695 /ORGANISM="Gymnochlora sp., Strain CCMP2014" /LENGTH=747 /DNA_ID=CAMNT_0007653955 /DNA_START=256 /DNA_END=2499 /DNA_ORIENTATION=-